METSGKIEEEFEMDGWRKFNAFVIATMVDAIMLPMINNAPTLLMGGYRCVDLFAATIANMKTSMIRPLRKVSATLQTHALRLHQY